MNTSQGKHIRISEVAHVTVVPHNGSIEIAVGAGGLSPTHTRAVHVDAAQARLLAAELVTQAGILEKNPPAVEERQGHVVDPESGKHRAPLPHETPSFRESK